MNYNADKLSILLSSDWFSPAWNLCGLQSDAKTRLYLQGKCRKIVESFVSPGSTYWEAEFSVKRSELTKNFLLDVFDSAELPIQDRLVFDRFLEGTVENVDDAEDASLVVMLCTLLISEYQSEGNASSQFSESLVMGVQFALTAMESDKAIARLERPAVTEWDRKLSDFTPDIPSFLVDVALKLSLCADAYSKFRAILLWSVSPKEYQRLLDWLNVTAITLTGRTLSIST